MKAEAADYLDKARHCLASAKTIAAAGVPDVAAREAYLAVYHGAEAYIFECTGKAAKTHRGVKSQFNRLARQKTRIGRDLLTFLEERAINSKPSPITASAPLSIRFPDDAASAIVTAERFIETIAELLLP